jgi:acetolactate synthase-1/2/3 large subunit
MRADNCTSAAQQLIGLCARLGVKYIFTNLGSDHPAFIEAFARLLADGKAMPQIIVCPHEMTTLSAAHGYAMLTRQPQVVLVHVDVGTQNLGCSVHNAARGRIPAIIVAGLSPLTENPERVGSRTEFIHYTQDAPRQHEIVGQYMKWTYEVRAAETVGDVLLRGLQIAASPPEGPVYISGAREIWEIAVPEFRASSADWPAVRLAGLPNEAVAELHDAICAARRPIVITTYAGRQPQAVERLVAFSDRLGVGVCEVTPQYVNFPGVHPHHLGYRRNTMVAEADLILMLDVDVPWIPTKVKPSLGVKLFHIDIDPIKQGLGAWHFPAHRSYQADSLLALDQLLSFSDRAVVAGREERGRWLAEARSRLTATEVPSPTGPMTIEEVTCAVRALVNERTIIIVEEPSGSETIPSILQMQTAGSYLGMGGAGLGWGINAAIGAKLAKPDAEVITLTGDGCFLFGVPSSAYWVAGTYNTPHLTIIYNNGGWHSPRLSTASVHPDGPAERNDTYWVTVGAGARLADIGAATGGADAYRVTDRAELASTLQHALEKVRAGRCAVVDVLIKPISAQILP